MKPSHVHDDIKTQTLKTDKTVISILNLSPPPVLSVLSERVSRLNALKSVFILTTDRIFDAAPPAEQPCVRLQPENG